MTTSDPGQAAAELATMHYPEAADAKVREYADLIGAHGIIGLLDKLRVFVAGDLDKALDLADVFARQSKLKEAAEKVNDAKLSLNAAWRGDAFDQYSMYSGMVVDGLNKGQASVTSLTKTVSAVAITVIDTYKNLLLALGNCAANLAQLSGKFAIVMGSLLVPPLAALSAKDFVDAMNSAFEKFWRDCNALLGAMITNIGALVGSGLELTAIETTFPKIPDVGTSAEVVGEPRRWRIKPGADPS
ncbi:hypothetical protein [Amycolatopsis sp. BJA-103]|uniref:hypothetical protein n=1 Tax=Amycolatopsis sp. BJA-103 TaxID=1911175 RepID=UPI000C77298E|nr:hypothetical protein [Amycolatopsis sp. BJA-103]AUI63006.1 hypothetical protein BKN51_35910 [Amycolatopsis sp. BJA-103]PNE18849.1 hypothetical protein B1H26_13610 [Amycolatopsis sp. BJA-103]